MRETTESAIDRASAPANGEAGTAEQSAIGSAVARYDRAAPRDYAAAAVGDAGWVLPLLGAVLLVSPFIRMASGNGAWPAVVYIFTVWAGLILLAAGLVRRASRAERDGEALDAQERSRSTGAPK
ncbi:MAG: hypothetical protein MRY74_11825 [Neomegalonema sp.]|nr:hypothetical protein [Neomegalonema sp.]